ncbi:hypothetical protein AB0F77_32635 [Streptomyces sp. NPDC026672]|uniref:hypothetical protein n=1 Tax=unclassified Streptomyces TaxID=2593676 RepID=UPI0033C88F4A
MTHAAPVPASATGTVLSGRAPAARTPDILGPRAHAVGKVALSVVLGLVYGYWAAANVRYGGPITGWNVLFGFVTAIVFMAVCYGLLVLGPRLPREVHATLWASFVGITFGFLYSLSGRGHSILGSAGLGLVVGASVFAVLFYRYYTHEDAEGHRIR